MPELRKRSNPLGYLSRKVARANEYLVILIAGCQKSIEVSYVESSPEKGFGFILSESFRMRKKIHDT
jgi:hypothetical protein